MKKIRESCVEFLDYRNSWGFKRQGELQEILFQSTGIGDAFRHFVGGL